MSFTVSARTILHLGSELISSDGVAFYELIKNSLDANSPRVTVSVLYRIEHETYLQALGEMGENRDTPEVLRDEYNRSLGHEPRTWHELRQVVLQAFVTGAPEVEDLRETIENATSREEFIQAIRSANRIDVEDEGDGMSMDTLKDIYLTIGTSNRARQKRLALAHALSSPGDASPVILGEKGLGRLSAMRLGDQVIIVTGEEGAHRWNQLNIDWNDFADAADADIRSVPVAPLEGDEKEPSEHGTLIRISALKASWSEEKLKALATEQFSKLVDPFDGNVKLPLTLFFNQIPVSIPSFANFLLDHAHGRLRISYITIGEDQPSISGEMEYRLHDRSRSLQLTPLELRTMTGMDTAVLRRVGPFELDLYWFNRRILTKLEGIGNLAVVRRILSEWTGGVALYRDGYRVNPYAGPNDDWLDLDRDAFSTSGFKLNRGQIIGRVRITGNANPYLIDQTNREGLKDNSEKRAFVSVLSSVVEIYRQFLNEIDRDVNSARSVSASEALDRFREEDERIAALLPVLEAALEPSENGPEVAKRLRSTISELRTAAEMVRKAAGAQEQERSRVLHLASIGLMIEILAHELYRATSSGLDTIAQARHSRDPSVANTSLRVLDAQLRTLQKRLKVLDPLSTNARQTKEEFELTSWVQDIVGGFASRHERSGIELQVENVPPDSTLRIKAVKGMYVQVLENLLSNSAFWIAAQHTERVRTGRSMGDDRPIGRIDVLVDTKLRQITVTDTGPGIPADRRETVFEPFFSTKPQKQGKGLGLYIAREIAEYHGGTLALGAADENKVINSVIFGIGQANG